MYFSFVLDCYIKLWTRSQTKWSQIRPRSQTRKWSKIKSPLTRSDKDQISYLIFIKKIRSQSLFFKCRHWWIARCDVLRWGCWLGKEVGAYALRNFIVSHYLIKKKPKINEFCGFCIFRSIKILKNVRMKKDLR